MTTTDITALIAELGRDANENFDGQLLSQDEVRALLQHIEGLERDARRWRWVLDNDSKGLSQHIQDMWAKCGRGYPSAAEWDSAIDAALAEQGETR